MNPISLYLLGRRLMQIAEGMLPTGRKVTSARLVYVDVAYHPNSSITEITERTGFPQSLVSTAVARLRDIGLLETEADPLDRRRTLVRPAPTVNDVEVRLSQVSIDDVVAKGLAPEHEEELPDVLAALDLLSRLLTPEVLTSDPDTQQPASDSETVRTPQ
jgi:DNA-binding MarR family transcriptional regulator